MPPVGRYRQPVCGRCSAAISPTPSLTALPRLHAKRMALRERGGCAFLWSGPADVLAVPCTRKVLEGHANRQAVPARLRAPLPAADGRPLRAAGPRWLAGLRPLRHLPKSEPARSRYRTAGLPLARRDR